MNIKLLNIKYTIVQSIYCVLICVVVGYASVYLLDREVNNAIIGLVLSLGNIFAVILQQYLATLIDTYESITLKKIVIILTSSLILFSSGVLFLNSITFLLLLFVVIVITLLNTLQPFFNSLAFEYEAVNITINFGLARGLGSLSYAITSLLLGNILSQIGMSVVPVLYVGLSILLFIVSYFFKSPPIEKNSDNLKEEVTKTKLLEFFKENKMFLVMLLATILLFYDQNIINSFFIQIINNVGGDSSHLGVAMFLAAAVELPIMMLYQKINRRVSCKTLILVASLFFSIKHAITYLAPNIEMLYMAQLLQSLAFALFLPTSVYIVKELVASKDLIRGQALFTGAITISGVLASFTGGILLDMLGVSNTLLVGLIISICGTLLMFINLKMDRQTN
ncbi:MAG: MFS transporter [Coprobacillaceae bacterium]